MFEILGWLFQVLLVIPITNVLVALTRVFGGNFGMAIIVFTIGMRLLTWPLTASQYKQSKRMQEMQPKIQELQKKYKGKDPKKMQAEMMAVYREAGFNPFGCLLPMLVQMPIWIALYRVIIVAVGDAPENLVRLSQVLYPWEFVHAAVPFDSNLLFWDLAQQDTTLILPIVVGVTMYVQQKLITPAPTAATVNTQQQQTQQMMLWMLPLMFGFFSLQVPSGLALYWAVSNIAGIVLQYFYMGRKVDWANMLRLSPPAPAPAARGKGAKPRRDERDERADATDGEGAEEQTEPVAVTGSQSRRRKRHGRRRGKR